MDLKDKIKIVTDLGFAATDAEKWYAKYCTQKAGAVKRGLTSRLTFSDYLSKVSEAGLTSPNQIGITKGGYVLGLTDNSNTYTKDNCRFIPVSQNQQEKLAKPYSLRSPDGVVHQGHNLTVFCIQNNLNQGAMHHVMAGKKPQYKGWTALRKKLGKL